MNPSQKLITGRTVYRTGSEWLYFAGTSYLGIQNHPVFLRYLQQGLDIFGGHYGGSRHANISLTIFEEAEKFLAKWTGMPAALLVSSGTLAGRLVIESLENIYPAWTAPKTHVALANRQSKLTVQWPEDLLNGIKQTSDPCIVIYCNSVNPLTAEIYAFDWINLLPAHRKYLVVIDDSHGLGIIGHLGQGIASVLPQHPQVEYLIISSLAKAMGIPAGVILGKVNRLAELYRQPLFVGSSPPSPGYLYALLQSENLYKRQRQKLAENMNYLFKHIKTENYQATPPLPILVLPSDETFQRLQQARILISSFAYPNPQDPVITRVVVNAMHNTEDLDRLLGELD